MIRSIHDFEFLWSRELEATQKILKHLTDRSLSQPVDPKGRTLGRIAWHLVLMIPEMAARTRLPLSGPDSGTPVPQSAKAIFRTYSDLAISLLDLVKTRWTDASLEQEDEMYGERWKRGETLTALVLHQVHHRGQMTVLMRQAGLEIPGMYGPSRQEWAAFGVQPPEV